MKLTKEEIAKQLHVVRGFQTWGRGFDLFEAMKNAKVTRKDSFTYYIFNDNTWDINDMGTVSWEKEDSLIFKQQFDKGIGEK